MKKYLVIILILITSSVLIFKLLEPEYPFGISSIKELHNYSDYVVIGHFTGEYETEKFNYTRENRPVTLKKVSNEFEIEQVLSGNIEDDSIMISYMKSPYHSEWIVRDDYDSKTKYVLFLLLSDDIRSKYSLAPSSCAITEIDNDGETLLIDSYTKKIFRSTNTLTELKKKIRKLK